MTRAYVDQPVTDIAGATDAAHRAAERWELPPPILLRQGMNAIFRSGDSVLRVATPNAPAEVSIRLADVLADAAISVPRSVRDATVRVGPFQVTAWPHIEAVDVPVDWSEVGANVRRLHEIDAASLPDGLPRPSPTEFPWWEHDALLAEVIDELDSAAARGLRAAIERHDGWDDFVGTDETVVCHGDVHPGNVIMSEIGPILIDWDLLCVAPRGWDHAPLMTWGERWGGSSVLYPQFAEGYGWSARDDRRAEAFAELRLVAATLMRWKAAQRNPAARPEAERRLAYWRGDPDAPVWRAQ